MCARGVNDPYKNPPVYGHGHNHPVYPPKGPLPRPECKDPNLSVGQLFHEGDGVVSVKLTGTRCIAFLPDWVEEVYLPETKGTQEIMFAREKGQMLTLKVTWAEDMVLNEEPGPASRVFHASSLVHLVHRERQEWISLVQAETMDSIMEMIQLGMITFTQEMVDEIVAQATAAQLAAEAAQGEAENQADRSEGEADRARDEANRSRDEADRAEGYADKLDEALVEDQLLLTVVDGQTIYTHDDVGTELNLASKATIVSRMPYGPLRMGVDIQVTSTGGLELLQSFAPGSKLLIQRRMIKPTSDAEAILNVFEDRVRDDADRAEAAAADAQEAIQFVGGFWEPDVDGKGSPSPEIFEMAAGDFISAGFAGRVGVGGLSGKLVLPGDVIKAQTGTKAWLVVISGQSNGQGVSTDGAGGDYTVNDRVFVHDGDDWAVADPGNEIYFTTTGNPWGLGKQNAGWAFAKRLQEQTGDDVYLIVAAQGGQGISQWTGSGKDSPIYAGMADAIEAAIGDTPCDRVDFFLWQQGEADALQLAGTYRTALATLLQQLRSETWFPADTPFIAGLPCPDWSDATRRDRLTSEINTLNLTYDPYAFVAQNSGLSGDGDTPNGNLHYSNASIYELGYNRYWRAMWNASSNIPVTYGEPTSVVYTVERGRYVDREWAERMFISQHLVNVWRNNGATTLRASQGSLVLSAKDGTDNVIINGLSARPQLNDAQSLGIATRAWSRLYLTSSIIQPLARNFGIYMGLPETGREVFRIGVDNRIYNRTSVAVMHDAYSDGYNVLSFSGSDGSARGEMTVTYSGSGGSWRRGVANSTGIMQYFERVDTNGAVRFPLAYSDFTVASAPNMVIAPDGRIQRSTTAGVAVSVSAAPDRTGQIAVVGGQAYIAVGTASAADWKQITT